MEENESVNVDPSVPPPPEPDSANALGSEAITDAAALPMDVDSDDEESSDGNWSSGSSFNDDSDDESILTYDTADDESINFVRPNRRSGWTPSCYSDNKGPFSRPDGEGSWRMDPEDSYSDYTLVVVSKDTGVERTYHVHKFTLAHGQCGCKYFAALFRTTCREKLEGSSRFTFPTEIANAFPDFLDILYNPRYMGNVSLFYRKFEENLYGGNLLPLRTLALYFGCRCLLSNIGEKIKGDINGLQRDNFGGVWATKTLVAALCEDETAEDAQALLGHIIQTLVRCFDRFSPRSHKKEEELSSIIEAMSPGALLSLLVQVTSTLTNRYRARISSVPFAYMIIEYLNTYPCISKWHFERIILYLLDLLLLVDTQGFADELASCAKQRGMYTDFVKRTLDGYVMCPLTVKEREDIIERLNNSTEVKCRKIIIEGKFEGNQCSAAVQYGGQALGGNQGDPDFFGIDTIPDFTLADLKAMIYNHINLRPELQRIEYRNEDGEKILFKETDTLESIEADLTDISLYLHAIPYCPRSISMQNN